MTYRHLWFWRAAWAFGLLVGLGMLLLYLWLPADGSTGDLESFGPNGFRVQWLLEEREDGLRVDDTIVRADGRTVEAWLSGATRGPGWRVGGIVVYEILRDGELITLPITLEPVSFWAIVERWALQLLSVLAFLLIGLLILLRRSNEPAPRYLMLACIAAVLQLWGDAYNFQFATVPWRWPFWFHLCVEQISFGLVFASALHFVLAFPVKHPAVERWPRLLPLVIYTSSPVITGLVMVFSPDWSAALVASNRAAIAVALVHGALGLALVVRSYLTARDPIERSRSQWLIWGVGVWAGIVVLGYALPLILGGRRFIPHPLLMLLSVVVAVSFVVFIMRYRLFAIDTVINRTLVYAIVTTVLGGAYLLLVHLLTLLVRRVLNREDDTLVVFVATLSIALAFAPLRRRIQTWIDRLLYRRQMDQETLLSEAGSLLARRVLPGQLAELMTRELPARVHIRFAFLAALDLTGESYDVYGCEGLDSLAADHLLPEFLREYGEPVFCLQPPSGLAEEAGALLEEHQIELCIPLIAGEELVGMYFLGPKVSGDAYSYQEVRLFRLLGRQAAFAVDNSRLFQAEHEQRVLAEALQEVAAAVGSTLDLDQVLDSILEQVSRSVPGDAFNIMLFEGDKARVVRWRGYEKFGGTDQIANRSLPLGMYPVLTDMIRKRRSVVVEDISTDPRWMPMAGFEWLNSYMAVPIQMAGLPIGFLNVDGTIPGQFKTADVERLEAFAHHAGLAIENARMYQHTMHRLARTQVLREVMLAAASTLDFDQVLERTVDTLAETMGVEFLCFAQPARGGDVLEMHPACVGYLGGASPTVFPLRGSVCGQVFRTGEALSVSRIRDLPYYSEGHPDIASELTVPVVVGEQVIGVLNIGSSHESAFDREDLEFYTTIAGQLAVALQNASLYEEVRHHAHDLAEALARLRELDRLKSEFIQNVSHELRLPLALILGYAELLVNGELGELGKQQQQPVEVITRRARMLGELVEDIILVLLTDMEPVQTEPVAVDDVARTAVIDFQVAADQAGLKLEGDIAPNVPQVYGGKVNMRRVLDNLIGNAIKFTPQGGRVCVRVYTRAEQVFLEVSDTGIGIPRDQQERIFDRFYQVDGSMSRRYSGAGLGLALVKEIVEAYGGKVMVESTVGEGSTFTVSLPAARSEDENKRQVVDIGARGARDDQIAQG